MQEQREQQAFVLRIAPSGRDRLQEALASDQIIIGWARTPVLLNKDLTYGEFRAILSDNYYAEDTNLRRAGYAAGTMWRFIREMDIGDLVVVPCPAEFYVAKISGPATHDPSKIEDDTAYRRKVHWLNDKEPIKRASARTALISRMKIQGTSARASDLLQEIKECLKNAKVGTEPTFQGDLQTRLVEETLKEMRTGRMDDRGFEGLIGDVLRGLGADSVKIVPRSKDKGADIVATFKVAGVVQQTLVVQAKHWQPEPPVSKAVVEQLIEGIVAESADLGMIVTTGTVSEEAVACAEEFFEDNGKKIELVDGEYFAKLIVEHGLKLSR